MELVIWLVSWLFMNVNFFHNNQTDTLVLWALTSNVERRNQN